MSAGFSWGFWNPSSLFLTRRSNVIELETNIFPLHRESDDWQQTPFLFQTPLQRPTKDRVQRPPESVITPVKKKTSPETCYPTPLPTPSRPIKTESSTVEDVKQPIDTSVPRLDYNVLTAPKEIEPNTQSFEPHVTRTVARPLESRFVQTEPLSTETLIIGTEHPEDLPDTFLSDAHFQSNDKGGLDDSASKLFSISALLTPLSTPQSPRRSYATPLDTPTKNFILSPSLPVHHVPYTLASSSQSAETSRYQERSDPESLLSSTWGKHVKTSPKQSSSLISTGTFENGQKLKQYQHLDLKRLVAREAGEEVCGTNAMNHVGLILAYEKGLGKTAISIALIENNPPPENFDGARATMVVVEHTERMAHWKSELTKFAPKLAVYRFDSRIAQLGPNAWTGIVLITYDQLRRQHRAFKENPAAPGIFQYLWFRQINDEAHAFQSLDAQRTEAVLALRKQHGLCLTSTPAQKSLLQFYPLYKFLGVTYENIDDQEIYERKICQKGVRNPLAMKLLNIVEKDFCIYRSPRTDITIKVTLSPFERIIYRHIRGLSLPIPTKLIHLALGTVIGRLFLSMSENAKTGSCCIYTLACDHPVLVRQFLEEEFQSERDEDEVSFSARSPEDMATKLYKAGGEAFTDFFESAKLRQMLQIVRRCEGASQRTAIFTCFTSLVPAIVQTLRRANIRWAEYADDMNHEDRKQALTQISDKRWSTLIIAISGARLGEWDRGKWKQGLDITSCNNVIMMEPWWNPNTEEQAIGCVHCIGQTLPVRVYHLVVNDSVENSISEKRIEEENIRWSSR